MEYRSSNEEERDTIYMMGYDTWSDGLSVEAYLQNCRNSKKYKSGRWFVLAEDGVPRASLLVHAFPAWGTDVVRGIGSVATEAAFRRKGFGHAIVAAAMNDLVTRETTSIIFLYSDISPDFYARHGFVTLPSAYQLADDSLLIALMLPRYNEAIVEQYYDKLPQYF